MKSYRHFILPFKYNIVKTWVWYSKSIYAYECMLDANICNCVAV